MMSKLSYFVIMLLASSCLRTVCGSRFKHLASMFNNSETTHYYVSVSSGSWNATIEDCKVVFGERGNLLSIETREEQKLLNQYLSGSSGGGSSYWTSGYYSTIYGEWTWAANDIQITDFVNWGQDEPKNEFGFRRITLRYINSVSSWWETQDDTAIQQYICEVNDPVNPTTADPFTTPDPTEPIECTTPNDLVVVLDSSGSIGLDNFSLLKQFVVQLAEPFTSTATSRFGFVVYSGTVTTDVDLTEDLTPAQITDRIIAATYQAGPTPTDQGIAAATRMLTLNNNGNPRTYLVITDGISNLPEETKREAEEAVAEGIRTFSLGVTENVSFDELLAIAGGISENMFHVSDFDSIGQRLAEITAALCPA